MSERSIRRYTNLAATMHVLQNRCLTLLDPSTWDDRNDAFFMAEFKRRLKARSVLALCFAETKETHHHWRVFSPGSDGTCLEIDKGKLLEALNQDDRIRHKLVTYWQINDVGDIDTDSLPFMKRYPFEDEIEFRAVLVDEHEAIEAESVSIPIHAITRITLSPWMPEALVDPVKSTLKGITGCDKLRIYRSTLIDNERWKRAANPEP